MIGTEWAAFTVASTALKYHVYKNASPSRSAVAQLISLFCSNVPIVKSVFDVLQPGFLSLIQQSTNFADHRAKVDAECRRTLIIAFRQLWAMLPKEIIYYKRLTHSAMSSVSGFQSIQCPRLWISATYWITTSHSHLNRCQRVDRHNQVNDHSGSYACDRLSQNAK